jgi:hypothetical protein
LNELALFSAKTHRRHNQISVNTLIVVSPAAGTFWDFHNFDINPVSPVDLGQPTSMVRNLHEEITTAEDAAFTNRRVVLKFYCFFNLKASHHEI